MLPQSEADSQFFVILFVSVIGNNQTLVFSGVSALYFLSLNGVRSNVISDNFPPISVMKTLSTPNILPNRARFANIIHLQRFREVGKSLKLS